MCHPANLPSVGVILIVVKPAIDKCRNKSSGFHARQAFRPVFHHGHEQKLRHFTPNFAADCSNSNRAGTGLPGFELMHMRDHWPENCIERKIGTDPVSIQFNIVLFLLLHLLIKWNIVYVEYFNC